MRKLCPRCGVVFEARFDSVFCSDKCRALFRESGLAILKGRAQAGYSQRIEGGDEHTEIFRPKKKGNDSVSSQESG